MVSLAAKAYQELSNKIIYGEFLPGDVLSENVLSSELNMSRTPIREALSRLTTEGFVITLKNRGILVKDISYKELFDIQGLNYALQAHAADLAADGVITFDESILTDHFNKQLKATKENNYIEYVNQSILFGRSMIQSVNNQTMLDTFDSLRNKTIRMAVVNWKLTPNKRHYSANEVNKKVLDAISNKEYSQIRLILREQLSSSRDRFVKNGEI